MASSGGKRIVEADEFVLKDSTGRVRARLGMAEEGPALNLYDENGQPTAMLGSPPGGPGLVLLDAQGKPRASVAVMADGPHVTLYDAEGKVRARWAVLENVPALTFDDDGGRTRLGFGRVAIRTLGGHVRCPRQASLFDTTNTDPVITGCKVPSVAFGPLAD